jgi:hypothetical protein
MKPAATETSRIFVAVGPAAADAAALTLAARLAHASGAELAAMFIEDLNLLRLAELPIAYEVGPASAVSRRLTTAGLEHAFKQQAAGLKRTITEFANTVQLRMSFQVVRGLPLPTLLEAATTEDLVIHPGTSPHNLPHLSAIDILRNALHRPAHFVTQPLVAVVQSNAGADRILTAALRLAQTLRSEIVLFLSQDDDRGALITRVDAWLARNTSHARIRRPSRNIPDNLGALIAREKPQAVLWQGDGASGLAAQANAVLDAIACPLIIVR